MKLPPVYRPSMNIIKQMVERAYMVTGYTPDEITGPSRMRDLAETRFAVMLAAHRRGLSTPRIGTFLGRRDHSTVVYGIRRARHLAATDAGFSALLGTLEMDSAL